MAIHYDQPDVGYAWVILGADFVLHFLASSAVVSMGIFLVEYLEQFHQSNAYTAGIAAAHMATWGLSGKNNVIYLNADSVNEMTEWLAMLCSAWHTETRTKCTQFCRRHIKCILLKMFWCDYRCMAQFDDMLPSVKVMAWSRQRW